MKLKLIMALVSEENTDTVIAAARAAGATGETVLTSARGGGLRPGKTFLGLDLAGRRDVVLFLVTEARSREILEAIAAAGRFDERPGAGIACQIAIEDAVGLRTQLPTLLQEIEEKL